MGRLVHFPRSATRRGSEPLDAADDAVHTIRATPDTARIAWIDVRASSDGDDDGDGGGRAA